VGRRVADVTHAGVSEYELVDWRRRMAALYAAVRAEADPAVAHELWRTGRDDLMVAHPQTPLLPDDPMRQTGVPVWPYDPTLRFQLPVLAAERDETLHVPTSGDGVIQLRLVGRLEVPLGFSLDVWWLQQYGGGIFVPLRDGTSGTSTYGGGRYLLDTAKSADLGGTGDGVIIDFNFAYHPSCRYNPRWECPLAPAGNRTTVPIEAGEKY
jgi:uncharacterized protein (DUF1684 family)